MREATQTKRRARGAALGAALLFAAVSPAMADEPAAPPQGESCPAAAAASVDLNAEAAELVRRIAEQAEQSGQNPAGDADFIVLNNRGYNYGLPPGVRFDPQPGDRVEPAPDAQ